MLRALRAGKSAEKTRQCNAKPGQYRNLAVTQNISTSLTKAFNCLLPTKQAFSSRSKMSQDQYHLPPIITLLRRMMYELFVKEDQIHS